MKVSCAFLAPIILAGWGAAGQVHGDDKTPRAQFGGNPQRNMANLLDKNIATDWSVEEGKTQNIKWSAELGTKTYGSPVVAGGKVYVGTNNAVPRDKNIKGKRSVLMCFQETDGKFLWQITHELPADNTFDEVMSLGLFSTPAIDGDRLYYVTPACEVICADTESGKIQWRLDMRKELQVAPFHCGSCSPLVSGDLVFVVTGNGNEEGKLQAPKAPSFLALHKKDGKVAWQSNLPGDKLIEGQWSNPTLATLNGKQQVIFPGGDNFLYGLDALTGKLVWKFNCNPVRGEEKVPNYMIATPVVHEGKVYVGLGLYPDHPHPTPFSYFLCVDITKTGDVSPRSLDAKAPQNKDSALVWAYGGRIEPAPKKGRRVRFGRTMSTCAVHDGLVYIPEENGYLHCLDARTGEKYWEHDFKAGVLTSPYYVDGKVYAGAEDGSIVIFQAGKTYKVLATCDMENHVTTSPVVANGVLYIATESKLYAIAAKK